MKQHIKTIIDEKLEKHDIKLLKALIKGEFRGLQGKYRESIALVCDLQNDRELKEHLVKEDILTSMKKYCKIFRLSSIQEVIRKLIHHKIFNIKVSEDYIRFLNEYSNKRHLVLMEFRKELIRLYFRVPDTFIDFCDAWKKRTTRNEEKLLVVLKREIEENMELQKCLYDLSKSYKKLCSKFHSVQMEDIINLFAFMNLKRDFIDETNILKFNIGQHVEILYFLILYTNNLFPVAIKRKPSKTEMQIVNYLINTGDEISYCADYKTAPHICDSIIMHILDNYGCINTNRLFAKIFAMQIN